MTTSDLVSASNAVEAAIARVLDAEHAAREAVNQAADAAAAMNEAARAGGRAVAERTERRLRAVRAAFEAQTTAEVAARDAMANDAGARHELSVDEVTRLDAAIATLAARMTEIAP